ncbi:hypothetical protein ACPA9J_08415 [Pseudomonas aeruginosa]
MQPGDGPRAGGQPGAELQSGTPPARPQRWIPERFILDCPA